tara:strand:+ start:80 stop:1198 length:1119 start_codon:yes stop_codon:yes gene_type:complete
MILLYNVYLDDKIRHPGLFYRGLYGDYNNSVNVFKYTLASVVDIYPWSKVIINVELNPTLSHRKEELFDYIKNLFSSHKLDLNNKRCEYQRDWKELYSKLDNDLIYFCCNHDHIFIDKNSESFIETVNEFRSKFSQQDASIYFSHWFEMNNVFLNQQPFNTIFTSNGDCTLEKTFAHTISDCFDSVQIITKSVYHKWWFTGDFDHQFLPRTDYFQSFLPTAFQKIQAVPYREYFRHFDGYAHIHQNVEAKKQSSNMCPPMIIPPGFFENDIKVRLGYEDNKINYVNINLSKENYTVVDNKGTDLKCYLDELPYFWKKRISTVDKNSSYDEEEYSINRNQSIINPLICGLFHRSFSNDAVLHNIKKTYNMREK